MAPEEYEPGATVRLYRLAQRLTQADLADRASLHRDTIVRVERGARPWPVTAKAIAEALGVPVAELFPPSEPRSATPTHQRVA